MEAIDAISWDCDNCGAENKSKEEFTRHVADEHLLWSKQNNSVINVDGEEGDGWWEQCIWCGQQTETIEKYWNHTAANHLRLGLPGAVIGGMPEIGNEKADGMDVDV